MSRDQLRLKTDDNYPDGNFFEVQNVIAAGEVRSSVSLIDAQPPPEPDGIVALPEPIYRDQTDDIPPGSQYLANAYATNHDKLEDPALGTGHRVFLHVVDKVGVIHAKV